MSRGWTIVNSAQVPCAAAESVISVVSHRRDTCESPQGVSDLPDHGSERIRTLRESQAWAASRELVIQTLPIFPMQSARYFRDRLISFVTSSAVSRIGIPRGTGCMNISVQP